MRATNLPRKNNKLQAYLVTNETRYKLKKDKKLIDLDAISALCKMGCTIEEIASIIGTSDAWLIKEREDNPDMAQAMELGYSTMKAGLRKTQVELAMSGNATMLIWLGKQWLGQSDKQAIETNTQINITVQRAAEELRNISKEQLLSSRDFLRHYKNEAQDVEFSEESAATDDPPPPATV